MSELAEEMQGIQMLIEELGGRAMTDRCSSSGKPSYLSSLTELLKSLPAHPGGPWGSPSLTRERSHPDNDDCASHFFCGFYLQLVLFQARKAGIIIGCSKLLMGGGRRTV